MTIHVTEFNKSGKIINSSNRHYPDFLDWMPLQAKKFWFLTMGIGKPDTKYVLLNSQGEKELLINVSLEEIEDHHDYKDRSYDAEKETREYIEKEGLVRLNGNQ